MNILVTGGAGFIGSHLCEKLIEKNHRVFCVDNFNDFYNPEIKKRNISNICDNKNFQLFEIDIRDKKSLFNIFKNSEIDLVIHLAAMAGVRPSIQNPDLYFDVNITGTLNLLEAAKENNVKKLILASSSSVYGNIESVPFKETDYINRPISPYASTKLSNEVMAYTYHHLYNMDIILHRFFTVYGPRQRPDLAIHKFVKKIFNKETISVFGDGTTQRDYTFVDDIMDGVTKSIDYIMENSKVYEIFNLGESRTIKLIDMINTIAKVTGIEPKLKYEPMQPGDVLRTYADVSKAKKILGYNPTTEFEDGIKIFVKWYKKSLTN